MVRHDVLRCGWAWQGGYGQERQNMARHDKVGRGGHGALGQGLLSLVEAS